MEFAKKKEICSNAQSLQREAYRQSQCREGWKSSNNQKAKEQSMNKEIDGFKVLPRMAMREEAFRRFEVYIAKGCVGTYTIKKNELTGKTSSFVVGFYEARRGFEQFEYTSTMIPKGYDLRRIKLYEGLDGDILVRNEYEEKHGQLARMQELNQKPVVMKNGCVEFIRRKQKPRAVVKVEYTPESLEQLIKDVQDGKAETFVDMYLLFTNNTLPQQEAVRERFKERVANVAVTELNEGYWLFE